MALYSAAPLAVLAPAAKQLVRAALYSTGRLAKGLILGLHNEADENAETPKLSFSPGAHQLAKLGTNEFLRKLELSGVKGNVGEVRTLHFPDDGPYTHIACVGLGQPNPKNDDGVDALKDNIRHAVAAGVRKLRQEGALEVDVDTMGDNQAAAEGVGLGLFSFDSLKNLKKRAKPVMASPLGGADDAWLKGLHLAEAQNLARELMEYPANLLTPTKFCERANEVFRADGHVSVRVRDLDWVRQERMGTFMAVAQGSDEPLKFLEIEYTSATRLTEAPVVLVGKGITFDSGGISIKPSGDMGMMRGDMGGAASVLGTLLALSRIKANGHFVGVIPLCENMPSGKALKPGDVITARSGTTVEVDNTDAEGRLILCDAMHYAEEKFKPRAMISVATLTGAIAVALGEGAAGVFTSSDRLWSILEESGYSAGDRLWRMPVFKHYEKQLESHFADICNVGGRDAGACTAAAFLRHFTKMHDYAHLDIAGVMHSKGGKPGMACQYLGKGMQGRPVRALVETCLQIPHKL